MRTSCGPRSRRSRFICWKDSVGPKTARDCVVIIVGTGKWVNSTTLWSCISFNILWKDMNSMVSSEGEVKSIFRTKNPFFRMSFDFSNGRTNRKGYIYLSIYHKLRNRQYGNKWMTQFLLLCREEGRRLGEIRKISNLGKGVNKCSNMKKNPHPMRVI